MDKDEYGEIVNGENTYKVISDKLKESKGVLIGWTDGLLSHYDIYFSLGVEVKQGNIQRGIKPWDLFIGIIGHNFYGFNSDNEKHWTYIAEKLELGNNETSEKVAELVNGVIRNLGKN